MTRRMLGGGDPFYLKFWVKLAPLEGKRRFSIDIRSKHLSRNS